MPASPYLYVGLSPGSFNDPFSPFDRQLRQDVHRNVLAPHRPHPMALSMAWPVQRQMQDITQQLPQQQPSQDSLRAALPRQEPQYPVTDEDFRRRLVDLGAPVGKFQPQERRVGAGRPRECELAAPKRKNYAPDDFERAQRCYKRYHNAWRNFHLAKSKLEKAYFEDKGRKQKITLRNAALLKSTKEDYLRFNRTGIPLKNSTSPEQKQKRLNFLRRKLGKSHESISKTQESLSLGKITEEEAAVSLQRQNNWKSKAEGEIADIEYGIQHEDILNEDQSTAGNANAGSVPPAHAGSLSQEGFRSDYPRSSSSGSSAYEMGENSHVSPIPEQHFITSEATPFHSHQLAPRNTEIGNTPHAKSGPPSEGTDNSLATINPRLLIRDPWIGGVPDTSPCPGHLTIAQDATNPEQAGTSATLNQAPLASC